jgi:uncharacterized membrane protein HdeD (DUF308 family)
MNLSLRLIRLFVLLIAGLAAVFFNHLMEGFTALFAVALTISAGLTVIYIFLQFDKPINDKIIMELIADGFSGIVLFTYPFSDERYFYIVFSFWIVWMGMLWLTTGVLNAKKEQMMWFYTLAGILFIAMGFVIMNYSEELISTVIYVIGFTLTLYSIFGLYLGVGKKTDIY